MTGHDHGPRAGPTDLDIIRQEIKLLSLRMERLERRLPAQDWQKEKEEIEMWRAADPPAFLAAIKPWETKEIMAIRQMSLRQRQAFALAMEGYSNAEIGERLGVQEGSVKSFLRVVFEKIGVHSRAALMDRYLGPWLHGLSDEMREAIVDGRPKADLEAIGKRDSAPTR